MFTDSAFNTLCFLLAFLIPANKCFVMSTLFALLFELFGKSAELLDAMYRQAT